MPASEIHYWQEFFTIYPFTQDREDIRTAQLLTWLANGFNSLLSQNAGKRMSKVFEPEDFMYDYLKSEQRAEEISLEQQHKNMEDFKLRLALVNKQAGIE